ncbi:MAG: sialate O-acetylesterase, partial [Luteolibacter sp.]
MAVEFAGQKAEATAKGKEGRWEVSFDAREASAEPLTLTTSSGDEKIVMENIVMGDVWVANGQSNMAFPLGKVLHQDTESVQANLPHLRLFSITTNEQADMQEDIRRE